MTFNKLIGLILILFWTLKCCWTYLKGLCWDLEVNISVGYLIPIPSCCSLCIIDMYFIPLLSVIGLLAACCLTKLDFLLQRLALNWLSFTMSEISWLALASYEAFQKPLVIFVSCIKMLRLTDTCVSVCMCISLFCLLCISLSECSFFGECYPVGFAF